MFTGIVEELGRVRTVRPHEGGARLEIECALVLGDAKVGASLAVNGCCLTVVDLGAGWWAADAVPETLARTTLGALAPGDAVNLERPLRPTDRLGGHVVQGHVDAVGCVAGREPQPDGSDRLVVGAPPTVLRLIVEKGSVAVDGVSLTVTTVDDTGFGVAVIPHTLAVTTLGHRQVGDPLNLEADILAKYVERLVRTDPAGPSDGR